MKRIQTLCTAAFGMMAVLLSSTAAMAQDAAGANSSNHGLMALAIAIGIGLAALGGALGQSRAAAAALEGIARNPNASDKVFVPMILGLSFIESLVLFAWVLMFMLLNKM